MDIIYSPVAPLPLTQSDKNAVSEIFYNNDLSLGGESQRRNAGCIMQHIIAHYWGTIENGPFPTENNGQTLALKHVGELICNYLTAYSIRITDIEKSMPELGYADVLANGNKRPGKIDFPNTQFPFESFSNERVPKWMRTRTMLELKCHFPIVNGPTGDQARLNYLSEPSLREDLRSASAKALPTKYETYNKLFMALVLVFSLRANPNPINGRPYECSRADLVLVAPRLTDNHAIIFHNHISSTLLIS